MRCEEKQLSKEEAVIEAIAKYNIAREVFVWMHPDLNPNSICIMDEEDEAVSMYVKDLHALSKLLKEHGFE